MKTQEETIDAKVIERIEKLLALAGSGNEHEARLAAEKAAEILTMYNLTIEDVRERTARTYDSAEVFIGGRITGTAKFIVGILLEFFFVKAVRSLRRIGNKKKVLVLTLIGKPVNVKVGGQVFAFLEREFPKCWARHADRWHVTRQARESYYMGLSMGIFKQLEQAKRRAETSTGLMVIKDQALEKFVKEDLHITSTHEDKISPNALKKNQESFFLGYQDGKDLHIQKGIEGSNAGDKQLAYGQGRA